MPHCVVLNNELSRHRRADRSMAAALSSQTLSTRDRPAAAASRLFCRKSSSAADFDT
jgi:hypothetical protein